MLKGRQLVLISLLIAGLGVALTIFLVSNGLFSYSTPPNLNNSELFVFNGACTSCTNNLSSLTYGLLSSYDYSPPSISMYIGGSDAKTAIENDLITSLPTVVLPVSAINTVPDLLSALVYLNVFNSNQNGFVLNTPFFAGVYHAVTYYDLEENRTVTSINIMNVSEVYRTSLYNASARLVNPVSFLEEKNASNMTGGNRTKIVLVYSDSPFSGLQSLILRTALSAFGAFSSQIGLYSSRVSLTQAEALGPQFFYDLGSGYYNSTYFSLEAVNLSNINYAMYSDAQKLLFDYDQNAISLGNSDYGNFMPFLDIGGKFVAVSSMLKPSIFDGMNYGQILAEIKSNSTVGNAFNDSVAFMDAVLCSYTENVQTTCRTPLVSYESGVIQSLS